MVVDYNRQTVLQKSSRFPAMFEIWSLEENAPPFNAPIEFEDKKQEFLN